MSCVMVMAGGTGGHVFPALAVAQQLQSKNISVVWLGTQHGIEAKVVPANNIPIEWVSIKGLRGKSLLSWLLAPFKLAQAMLQSFRAIRKVKPDCVLGMGGFVAGPGGLVARLCNKPLIVHEQNAVVGLTNFWLAKIAQHVLTGFAEVEKLPNKAQWVGNPVRAEITRASQRQQNDKIHLLIVGGSQGAYSFNKYLPVILGSLTQDIQIWHQTGRGGAESVEQAYQQLGNSQQLDYKVSEFIDDMAAAYQWADMLICRAGAMTVAECCAAGVPALFVPYPYSAGDHQIANAQSMVSVDAAMMVENADLNTPIFRQTLETMLNNKSRLVAMGENAARLHKPHSAQKVASICEEYCHA